MNIIPIHNKVSKPVTSYSQIKDQVEELKKFIKMDNFGGLHRKAVALHHSQVSDDPYNFFVIHSEFLKEGLVKYDVIINPKINKERAVKVEGDRKHITEACMSFPYRKPVKMLRYFMVPVDYQTYGLFGLKAHEDNVTGILAQVFQHEIEHSKGRNIYTN